ncbi:MAG: hypothetical protein ACFCVD_10485 [Nodosilinea sp.]
MMTNQSSAYMGHPAPINFLGIIFFLLGAPHIYGFLQRRARRPRLFTPSRYVAVALLAGAIAGAIEISLL